MSDLSQRLLDAIKTAFPHWKPGTRASHYNGVAVRGYFHGSNDAWRYCDSKMFGLHWTEVIVRFSNASAQDDPDWIPQVRGMAVKFIDAGPSTDQPDADLICMTPPVFVSDDPERVVEFGLASKPTRAPRFNLLQQLWAMLTLRPVNQPAPGVTTTTDKGVRAWAKGYRKSHAWVAALALNATLPPPASYGRLRYNAVHAFTVKGPDGDSRFARFSFEPAQGVRTQQGDVTKLPTDYLRQEIGERLGQGPVRYTLRMQIAEPWDDPTDPTVAWPTNRTEVLMGTLVLTHPDVEDPTGRDLGFNVGRLPAGIQPAGDRIFDARIAAYNQSQTERGLGECPFAARSS